MFFAAFALFVAVGYVGSETEEQLQEAVNHGGFESIDQYKAANKVGAATKIEYDEHLKAESEKKLNRSALRQKRSVNVEMTFSASATSIHLRRLLLV